MKTLIAFILKLIDRLAPATPVHAMTIAGDQTLNGRAKLGVEAPTAAASLSANENGTIHTNAGAVGEVVLTLPAAVAGLHFYFGVREAQALTIEPATGETISLPSTGVPESANDFISANAVGETVHLMCVEDGSWACMGFTGTWAGE